MGKKFARGAVVAAAVAGLGAVAVGAAQAAPSDTLNSKVAVCWNVQPGLVDGNTGIACTTTDGYRGSIYIVDNPLFGF